MAVPVRAELLASLSALEERRIRAGERALEDRRSRLRDLGRALPRPQALTEMARQRLDFAAERLPRALLGFTAGLDARLGRVGARLSPVLLQRRLDTGQERLGLFGARLAPSLGRASALASERYSGARFAARSERALTQTLQTSRERLGQSARMLETLSYKATLERGFAAVRGPNGLARRAADIGSGDALEIEFADGRVSAVVGDAPSEGGERKRRKASSSSGSGSGSSGGAAGTGGDGPQGSLF